MCLIYLKRTSTEMVHALLYLAPRCSVLSLNCEGFRYKSRKGFWYLHLVAGGSGEVGICVDLEATSGAGEGFQSFLRRREVESESTITLSARDFRRPKRSKQERRYK